MIKSGKFNQVFIRFENDKQLAFFGKAQYTSICPLK